MIRKIFFILFITTLTFLFIENRFLSEEHSFVQMQILITVCEHIVFCCSDQCLQHCSRSSGSHIVFFHTIQNLLHKILIVSQRFSVPFEPLLKISFSRFHCSGSDDCAFTASAREPSTLYSRTPSPCRMTLRPRLSYGS